MDPPRKYIRKDTSYQSLRTDSSLEEAKGAARAKNKDEKKGYGDQDQPTGEAATIVQEIQDDDDLVMICSAFKRLQLKDRQEHGRPARGESEAEPVERNEPEDGASK